MIRLRLIGTADEVDIALHRLRDVFTKVTASEPLPCREVHGQVRVYVEATF